MKQYWVTLALLGLFVIPLAAQQTAARKMKMNVMGTSHQGYAIKVPYAQQKAYDYWLAFLKDQGKVSEKRNYIEIKEAPWLNSSDFASVFSRVEGDATEATLWMGLSAEADEGLLATVEAEVNRIPLILRRYELQAKIKEAEQAASFLSRELRNVQREGERLNTQLERNQEQKIELDSAMARNAREKSQLSSDLQLNNKEQSEQQEAFNLAQKQLEQLRQKLQQLQQGQ